MLRFYATTSSKLNRSVPIFLSGKEGSKWTLQRRSHTGDDYLREVEIAANSYRGFWCSGRLEFLHGIFTTSYIKVTPREYLPNESIKYLHFEIRFNVFSNVNLDTLRQCEFLVWIRYDFHN